MKKEGELNAPKKVATDLSGYHGTANYAVVVDDKFDLGYVLSLMGQAFDKLI